MYQEGEDRFYYIMLYNEDYAMPEMPDGCEEGIIKGIYKFKAAEGKKADCAAVRQRPDLERSFEGAVDSGGKIRRAGRRVERDQLQRAASRRAGCGALEPAASGGEAKTAIHLSVLEELKARSSRPPTT